jgi:hypothetical protein
MKQQFDAATAENQKRALLCKYGYGIANYALSATFDPMRNDPRFDLIVKKTGLLDN